MKIIKKHKYKIIFILAIILILLLYNFVYGENNKINIGDSMTILETKEKQINFSQEIICLERKEEIILKQVEEAFKKEKEQKEIKEINEVVYYDIPLSNELQEYTYKLCIENNISYELILALMRVENHRFDSNAVSKDGHDKGLCQLRDKYVEDYKKNTGFDNFDFYNPYHNIKAAIIKLRKSREEWLKKDTPEEFIFEVILNSYNMGTGKYIEYISRSGTRERNYSNKVLKYKMQLEEYGHFK